MSIGNKYDFVEVAHEAASTVFGRVILILLSLAVGVVGVFFVIAQPDFEIFRFEVKFFLENLISSMFSLHGFIVAPLLALFSAGFIRYEWPLWTLIFSFAAPWLFAGSMF